MNFTLKAFASALILTLVSSCSGISRPHYVEYHYASTHQDTPGFDWERQGPVEFLKYLQEHKLERGYYFPLRGVHYGWVRASDIPELIRLLNSKVPCLPVSMSASSWWPTEPSTVGHEAAYLIEGFRSGRYPSQLNSTRWPATLEDRRRFEEWVREFNKQFVSRQSHD